MTATIEAKNSHAASHVLQPASAITPNGDAFGLNEGAMNLIEDIGEMSHFTYSPFSLKLRLFLADTASRRHLYGSIFDSSSSIPSDVHRPPTILSQQSG